MQAREKGRRIQLIRAEYVPAARTPGGHLVRGTGRAFSKVVATFPYMLNEIPADVARLLSEKEQAQVTSWLEDRVRRRKETLLRYDLDTLPDRLAKLAAALPKVDLELSAKKARKLNLGMNKLASALGKAGFKRPKKSSVKRSNKTASPRRKRERSRKRKRPGRKP